jgi:uncharacterized protein YicC (UPF0701 family)
MHPDCAVDDRERERRHRPMAEANAAYAAGDAARLRAILEQWHSNPEMVEGEGIGADLIRTIRKIHQVERRLAELSVIVTELRESPLHTLLKDASTAAADNRDLLAEMADRLRADITEAQSRLANAVSTMEPAV